MYRRSGPVPGRAPRLGPSSAFGEGRELQDAGVLVAGRHELQPDRQAANQAGRHRAWRLNVPGTSLADMVERLAQECLPHLARGPEGNSELIEKA